jgi:D-sedoheptulose 7-phosphate isomerase
MPNEAFHAHTRAVNACIGDQELYTDLYKARDLCVDSLQHAKKLLICGNGGSAGDAQHFAAELTGKYKKHRPALAAVALTTDTSALTAIGNDYGFDMIFSRQIEALGQPGDVLIAITTSGRSKNILEAVAKAKERGLKTIGLTGADKTRFACDIMLRVPSCDTARIQECHLLFEHILCEMIEEALFGAI